MNIRNLLVILCAGLLAVSCSSNKKSYVINGVVPDSTYNGQFVYLFDYNEKENIDSTLIEDGKFTFTGLPDTVNYVWVKLGRLPAATVIREGGVINVDLSDPLSVTGTPLNDELVKYRKEKNELGDFIQGEYKKIQEQYKDDEPTRIRLMQEKGKEMLALYNSFNEKYFPDNKNNALGVNIFLGWYYELSVEKIDSLYAEMGENIKNQKAIQQIIEANEHKKQTAVGKPFVDFTVENGNLDGTPVSFSDYIGKGKYVLVDFWASWCGPCLQENPVIAEVYAKYKGDKFNVLGVAVSDKREATLNAIKTHNVVWPQIIDAQRIPLELYGINGIPHIILFGPDGTILARDLRGDVLKAKVAEVLQ